MKLSHSKLTTILNNPAEYYLSYKQGIQLKQEKTALTIGSAVHWGLEHNTDDLEEFWNQAANVKNRDNYGYEQVLSEAMVHGYLTLKPKIFDEILEHGKYKLQEEYHELTLTAKLGNDDFLGIIDLLLLTDKGFIIEDYKTSSSKADWTRYTDQIYRYIYLVESNFPGIPVISCGIINLVKSKIRQKKNENINEFLIRLKKEYEVDDNEYIEYHLYRKDELNMDMMADYINNLKKGAQLANLIDNNQDWYINYPAAIGIYGKSDYYDIFYNTKDAYLLYKIKDKTWNKETSLFQDYRDCVDIDMQVLKNKNILNHYSDFEKELCTMIEINPNIKKEEVIKKLKSKYQCNDMLLDLYFLTFNENIKNNNL